MTIITEIIEIYTALLNVLEAGGRIRRRAVMHMRWAIAFMVVASLLTLAAAAFFLVGIYQYVASQLSPVVASFVVSLLSLVLALIFAGIAKHRTR